MKEEKEAFEWTGEVLTAVDIQKEKNLKAEKKLIIDPDKPIVYLPRLIKMLRKINDPQPGIQFYFNEEELTTLE